MMREGSERDLVARIVQRLERQLFVHTILMVLERAGNHNHKKTTSIIVFEQAYQSVEL